MRTNQTEESIMEWIECKYCIYFDECENKEDREGCYCGEYWTEEDMIWNRRED